MGRLFMRSTLGQVARAMTPLQNVFCSMVRAARGPEILVTKKDNKNGEECGARLHDVCTVCVVVKLQSNVWTSGPVAERLYMHVCIEYGSDIHLHTIHACTCISCCIATHPPITYHTHTCFSISLALGLVKTPCSLFWQYHMQGCRCQGDPEAAAHS